MKKLIFLGGSDIQVPAIKYAKSLGYYIITIDYLPENPGHILSDKYYNISTIDKDKVLEVAEKENVDGIISYASDPSALTASYVSEKLGLPGVNYESCKILSNKHLFRKFLANHNFPFPKFKNILSENDIHDFLKEHKKCIIKPVDSSGSKGISIISLKNYSSEFYKNSLNFSRSKKVIVEEFIEKKGKQLCGDVLIIDGKLIFSSFGNVHFDDKCNGLTPCSITLPSEQSENIIKKINSFISDLFEKLNINYGCFNIDLILDKDDKIYILDIGARNGGNLFTELIKEHTGIDIVRIIIDSSCDKNFKISDCFNNKYILDNHKKLPVAHYVLHTNKGGLFKEIEFKESIINNIFYKNIKIKTSENINKFNGSNNRIGLCLLKFKDKDEMLDKIINFEKHININFYEKR